MSNTALWGLVIGIVVPFFGLFMALITNDSAWLVFCLTWIIFLS